MPTSRRPSSPTARRVRRAARARGLALAPVATGDAAYGYLSVDPGPDNELGADAHRLLDSFAGVIALAAARSDFEEQAVRRRSLEESDRLRRALLHSVSHDLRTPLTAIRTIAAALRDGDVDAAERDSMLGDVEHEASRLTRLVTNLLEVSRVESGALRPARVPVPSRSSAVPPWTTRERHSPIARSRSTSSPIFRPSRSTRRCCDRCS